MQNVSSDEKQLIRECLAGRTEAFGELVIRYQDRLLNALAGSWARPTTRATSHKTPSCKRFSRLKTFRGQSAFYSWLFRIALNAAASQKRRTRRKRARSTPLANRREAIPPTAIPMRPRRTRWRPTNDVPPCKMRSARLPAEFRIPLVLKEIDGMKYHEIAAIVGCPVGTVRSRIHRARSELRQRLELLLREKKSPSPRD